MMANQFEGNKVHILCLSSYTPPKKIQNLSIIGQEKLEEKKSRI